MEPKVITLPLFHVVGYRVEATVEEFESGLGRSNYHLLLQRKDEIQYKKNENVMLMQIYPMNADFNPKADAFTHILCYEVSKKGDVPPNMSSHTVPESKYAAYTHKGPESELALSYDYIRAMA